MLDRRQSIELVVFVNLLVGVLAPALIAEGFYSASGPVRTVLLSVALSQGSLLAIWAVCGGRPTPWRVVAAIVGIVVWIWVLGEPAWVEQDPWWSWSWSLLWGYCVCLLLCQMVPVTGLLLLARLVGVGVTHGSHSGTTTSRPRLQFSIRSLLEWTTALAMLLGTFHYIPEDFFISISSLPPWRVLSIIAIVGSGVLIAPAALWTALGTRLPLARYCTLLVAVAAAVATMTLVLGEDEFGYSLVFGIGQTVWLVGSLWVFRLLGYRLVWRRRTRL